MRERASRAALGALLAALVATPSAAAPVELETTGWWRTRYQRIDGLPLDPERGGGATEYFDHRAALLPRIRVGDRVRLNARVDVLDGVVLGQNEGEPSILAGLSDATSQVDRSGAPVDDFRVERLYADIRARYGVFRIGRTHSQWGLGLVADAANALEWGAAGQGPTGRGDTVDRVAYGTDLGVLLHGGARHLYTGFAYDRLTGSVIDGGDDVDGITFTLLSTPGSYEFGTPGGQEAGLYVSYTVGGGRADVALVDLYFHVETTLARRWRVFLEGEGAVAFGSAERSLVVPETGRDPYVDAVAASLAEVLPTPIAEAVAHDGSRVPVIRDLVVDGLLDAGLSPAVAEETASSGASAGFDVARDEEIDLFSGLGVLRAGVERDGLGFGLEWGYAGGGNAATDALPNVVGPIAAGSADAQAVVGDELLGRSLVTLTGTDIGTLAFDREYDVALILYREAGPLRVSTLSPGVQNTTYAKGQVTWRVTEAIGVYGAAVWGQLLEPVETFRVDRGARGEALVVPEGRERALGVELDAGVDVRFGPHLRAELKVGYLFAGAAFGSNADDVFMVRPQMAVMF